MPKALKHFLLQGMILLLWLLFVIFPITDTRVEAQASCVNPVNYKYLSPNPGVSWYADTTVTVRIDDNWNASEQAAIKDGNLKWNDSNCSGVEFDDFTEKTYTQSEYDQDPPDGPILIDVNGNGFILSNAANGVQFDLRGNGTPKQFAWTIPSTDDAWLVLDRNGNGTVDNGQELFGNYTPQPEPPVGEGRNGFLALAEYDKPINGGNNDGKIKKNDSVFSSLRLWQDSNHNGISEASELFTLSSLGLKTIHLDYQTKNKVDEFGNLFRYRAKVKDHQDTQLGRWAWDVFLVSAP